jgi:hypothetical protein
MFGYNSQMIWLCQNPCTTTQQNSRLFAATKQIQMNIRLLGRLLLSVALLVPRVAGQYGRVIGLKLVRASTGVLVTDLVNGATVYLNGANSTSFTVVAVVTPATGNFANQVRFGWNTQPQFRTDPGAPFTLCGPNYLACTFAMGAAQTVTATVVNTTQPYAVTFNLNAGSAPATPPNAPPVAPPNAPIAPPANVPVKSPPTTPTSGLPILINCGSTTSYTDSIGRVWGADRFVTGGITYDANTDGAYSLCSGNEDAKRITNAVVLRFLQLPIPWMIHCITASVTGSPRTTSPFHQVRRKAAPTQPMFAAATFIRRLTSSLFRCSAQERTR